MLFIYVVVVVLKLIFRRERPVPQDVFIPFSFPSLHAAVSFGAAYILGRIRFKALWYEVAALVAIGRVYTGAHHLSDVVVGAVLGLLIAWWVWKKWDVSAV